MPRERAISHMISRRTSGSPPVIRSLRTPLRDEGARQPVEFLQVSSSARQERHVLGHAIDAAEIAAIGDRDPQIGDGAAEGVDQGGNPVMPLRFLLLARPPCFCGYRPWRS